MDTQNYAQYNSPFGNRYSSTPMRYLFSDQWKYKMWRTLWIYLAEAEKGLSIPISPEQIGEMVRAKTHINFDRAKEIERDIHHDVMAHLKAYAEQCPTAAPIMHLGATSCYITDNTEVVQMGAALKMVRARLSRVISRLDVLAVKYCGVSTLAYTHLQAAQPTTVGKRMAMWSQDLKIDLERLDYELAHLRVLGCRGATGTAASFLELFDGDAELVVKLEEEICQRLGYKAFPISGQTYTRKQDFNVMQVLSGIAQSASKFANDMRLLAHMGEMSEPFGDNQVGSSAMPYKHNPMMCERITGLARYVICDLQNVALTASTQWLERTLDDSSNRRVSIPEAFLAVDDILAMYENVVSGLVVHTPKIADNLKEKLPYMMLEGIMMYCVKHHDANRQTLHEKLRVYTTACANGTEVLEAIRSDCDFGFESMEELRSLLQPERLTGIARKQVIQYVKG